MVDDVDFFALTIGKKGSQLYRGRRFEFEPVDVPAMPLPAHLRHPRSGQPRKHARRRGARSIMGARQVARRAGHRSRLHQLAGTGKTIADRDDLTTAGKNGSIRDLLVARSAIDDTVVPPMSAADRRTVVAVVTESLRHKATIHIVDEAAIAGDLRIAAVLRY